MKVLVEDYQGNAVWVDEKNINPKVVTLTEEQINKKPSIDVAQKLKEGYISLDDFVNNHPANGILIPSKRQKG